MFDYLDFKSGDNITYLELLRPDGKSLGELKNAYKRRTTLGLDEVATLTFNLPNVENLFNIISDDQNTLGNQDIDNKDIGRTSVTLIGYQLKAIYSNGLEIIYMLPEKTLESDMLTTETSITCYSREHELSRYLLLNYRGVLIDGSYVLDGLSLEEVVRDILGTTYWTTDFLDNGYNNDDENVIRRSIDEYNNVSILATIDSVCSIFGAIPIYDTINRKVSFYKANNYDYFKYNGLIIDEDNYLTKVTQKNTTEEMITRLYVLGKDDLTINDINPTGVSYIEDLSYFIYPAQLNTNKDALTQSSKYMSDSLAFAELIYEDKISTSSITFKTLYTQKDEYQKELITLENQMTALNTELDVIQDEIDIYVGLSTANNNNASYVSKRTEKDNKQAQIDNKQAQIDNKQAQIDSVDNQINILYNSLKMENNFTNDQLKERQCYIYEGLYTNTGISISQDLYDEACEYLGKKKEPSIVCSVDINSILSIKSKQSVKNYDKIKLGEQIDIFYSYKGIDMDVRAQILGLEIDEEENSMSITIANTIDYKKNSSDYLENILKRSITTSTLVDTNIVDWNKGVIALDELDDLYTQGIDAAKIQINSAVNNTVTNDARGITIKDTSNPLRFVRQTNGVIALTKDGGRTYSTAITPDGVWAERLIGQIILGQQLYIQSSNDYDNGNLYVGDIPANTYHDVKSDNTAIGNDFGLVVSNSINNVFVSLERGFKITTANGTTLLDITTSGKVRAKGIEIISQDGYSILDGVNILQSWQDTISDSCDASHPVNQYIYIPSETSAIRTGKLSLRRLNYRAYSTATGGGGASTQSTTSGGGGYYSSGSTSNGAGTGTSAHQHTIMVQGTSTSVSNAEALGYHVLMVQDGGGGNMGACAFGAAAGGKLFASNADGLLNSLTPKTYCTINDHSHWVNYSVPSHTHDVSIQIPNHTHGLSYGISEQSFSGNITVKVNGTTVGTYSSDQSSIDIKAYLTKGAWNTISYTPNGNARVQGTVFIQAMVGVPN